MRQTSLTLLRADCANCFGLCCVAPAFARSADFAIDKPAGRACPNLGSGPASPRLRSAESAATGATREGDAEEALGPRERSERIEHRANFRCGIHSSLRERGFAGCTVFDCFGAGQQISQATYAGRDWQSDPAVAGQMFAAFGVMRHLHELLYYLTEALEIPRARRLHAEVAAARDGILALTDGSPDELVALDVAPLRAGVGDLLSRVSDLARPRRAAGSRKRDRRGEDLIGAVLTGTDLRGTTLRGTYLIGADLTDADLRDTDLLGTDLRGANLSGANLEGALFLLQSQLDAARGDARTTLPAGRTRPRHWQPDAPSPPLVV